MMIKEFIRSIIPEFFLAAYRKKLTARKQQKQINRFQKVEISRYKSYLDRYVKYSKTINGTDTAEKIISSLIEKYHVIEKGLTLSAPVRLGFGQQKLAEVIDLCDLFIDKHGTDDEILLDAVSVVREYDLLHKRSNFAVESILQTKIDHLLERYDVRQSAGMQPVFTKQEYFSESNAPFDIFSSTRHSIRDFSLEGDIDMATLEKAISLAQNAPSACNRQSVRLHILVDKTIIDQALMLQNGNRGFGDKVNKLIIVTSDLQDWKGGNERFAPYFDSGIYTMNLLYALHFHKIGACALNWYTSDDKDISLRNIARIPDNEVIAVLIACGLLKDEFKCARSKRRDYRAVMRVIE